jgi:uncharacterized protein YeeX (DUF496 family)
MQIKKLISRKFIDNFKKIPTNKKFILIHLNFITFLNLYINLEEIIT